jgi:hypothetical protein
LQEKSSQRLDFLRRLDIADHGAPHNLCASPILPPPLAESDVRG